MIEGQAAVGGDAGSVAHAGSDAGAVAPVIDSGGNRLALLVGIDQYAQGEGTDWPTLRGCVGDIERVSDLLQQRFGFRAEDILVLTNEEATHEALVRAIDQHLIQQAGPDTEVLYWHSGHGSRVPDLSDHPEAEFQEQDSTLVPYDARSGGHDFTDDEMQSLLRALCAKTDRVTVITDSCHSGGVTRGPGERVVRGAPAGSDGTDRGGLPASWPAGVPFLEDGDPLRGTPLPYIHIAACASYEQAEEIRVRDARGRVRHFGALSFFLCQALREAPPAVSFRWLAREAAVRVARHAPMQSVQFEGPLDRLLFAGDFSAPPAGFAAVIDPEARLPIEVQAGQLHLLRVGSRLQVLGEDGTPLGEAELVRVGDGTSLANWSGEAPDLTASVAARVIELSRPSNDPPLRIYLPPGDFEDQLAAALAEAEDCPLEILREPLAAEYQLQASKHDGAYVLRTDSGLGLWNEVDPPTAEDTRLLRITDQLTARLRLEHRHRALLALAESPSSVAVELEFSAPSEADWQEWAPVYGLGPYQEPTGPEGGALRGDAPAMRIVDRPGDAQLDLVKLSVHMPTGPAQKAMYLSVLCVSQDRSTEPIFPKDTRQDNLLEPGETLVLPPINVFVGPQWPDSQPLRDRYLAILTPQYQDFAPLVSPAFLAHGPSAKRGSSGSLPPGADDLPPVLKQALIGSTKRGGSLMPKKPGFGVASADLVVYRPLR